MYRKSSLKLLIHPLIPYSHAFQKNMEFPHAAIISHEAKKYPKIENHVQTKRSMQARITITSTQVPGIAPIPANMIPFI